jgi:hypothetical protein
MADRGIRQAYRRRVWSRARAELREFSRQKGLATSAASSSIGIIIALTLDWRMTGSAFNATALVAGAIGAIGGPAVVYVVSLLHFRLRAPYQLDEDRREDLKAERERGQRLLGEANERYAAELAEVSERHRWELAEAKTAAQAEVEGRNALAERYNTLLEAQFQPHFRFVTARMSVGAESFDSVEVWNDGPPLENYAIMQRSFLEIFRSDIQPPQTRYLHAYYFRARDYHDNAMSRLLVTFYAWYDLYSMIAKNNARNLVGTLQGVNETKEYERLAAEVNARFQGQVVIKKRVFLDINYMDRVRTWHRVIYELYPPDASFFGPTAPIERDGPKSFGGLVRNDLKSLTATNILDQWEGMNTAANLGLSG